MNLGPVLVDVATKDLKGAALDWAVGVVEGGAPIEGGRLEWVVGGYPAAVTPGMSNNPYNLERRGFGYCPSTEWHEGGPLIDKYKLRIDPPIHGHDDQWTGVFFTDPDGDDEFDSYEISGATPLIALCRALVEAKLGDIVKVPACLVMP
ncbi:DUF2591 domain-containing protein [Pseudomonas sp. PAMC 29040]|uniref:phage protein NinX family protein n=1 Tax=Pseudomonas sp. PAMC 29040 TaxID=2498450 RepID=UPI000FA909A4|nr:phage protein NinX family protein [Pseudomonas sp. PAMC 29040]RUT30857.1 DUF2591 domain-containing protein [Pseudomonas sp. PAMC 29040]